MAQWLFVSDVDDTLLGDDEALQELASALRQAGQKIVVAYNSSRPCASLRTTLTSIAGLPTPQFLVGAMGTEIEGGANGQKLADYQRALGSGWQRHEVAAVMDGLGLTPHEPEFQTPLKASYTVPPAAAERVLSRLTEAGLSAKVVYSSRRNLDLLPSSAGKAAAVEYLRQLLDVKPERVIVAGDSANDAEMFMPGFKGIVVANADPDLKGLRGEHIYHAKSLYAAGVLEGLRFWGALE